MDFLQTIAEDGPIDNVEILGPVPSAIEKRAERYRAVLLLSAKTRAPLHQELDRRIAHAEQLATQTREIRWSVDVDPVDLL